MASPSYVPLLADASPARLRSVCGDDPGFWCRELLNATGNRTAAGLGDALIGIPLKLVGILLVAFIVNRLARRGVRSVLAKLQPGAVAVPDRLGRLAHRRDGRARRRPAAAMLAATQETSVRTEQRIDALSSVLRSVVSFVVFAVAVFMMLGEIGIDLRPLLAGAGILGLAIGFGAQSLVKDFLSGMFILVEDQFGVGDIIELDADAQGTVEMVSLRTTRLRAVDGTVWHVPNGEIAKVGNKSQLWSRSLLDVEVAYDTDIEQAKNVIKSAADAVWKEKDSVLEEPDIWGVEALDANGVTIRLVVKTTPAEQWRVSRILRERIKAAFDEAGIQVPFPQQLVWQRPPSEEHVA
ncbi:MAG: mechanosensitive ion channel family protein [Solirubrobacterales bacterium]|nr:mechanosensitive ion channel family protein [Solirubrobacterales bacterium]